VALDLAHGSTHLRRHRRQPGLGARLGVHGIHLGQHARPEGLEILCSRSFRKDDLRKKADTKTP
jgi:hypothetical protein